VIVGTADMVGSRLPFADYGRGFKSRPLHAGLIGQDALLVHHGAHLEPVFQELITAIQLEEQRCRELRPLLVTPLPERARNHVQPVQ
jgi:CRISPR-associated endonuclease/helicase Cas3